MFIDGPHRTADGPSLQILSWRLRRLLEAGFGIDLAEGLAADRRMDLHALLQLVERGCPPERLNPSGPRTGRRSVPPP